MQHLPGAAVPCLLSTTETVELDKEARDGGFSGVLKYIIIVRLSHAPDCTYPLIFPAIRRHLSLPHSCLGQLGLYPEK